MVLGVDVGGTKVAVAAVDGVTVREAAEDPTAIDTTEALLDGIEAAVRRMIDRVGQPEAIGVGVPSQIEYATGRVETSVNIP
ncbi:MAG: glucokinase, partial [Thermoleophilaceae bacterium]|nr:glucokinase [Thermoleophilaceae bacterium]